MTALDLIRKTTRQRTAIDYVFEIALSLLVWPLAGYVCGTSHVVRSRKEILGRRRVYELEHRFPVTLSGSGGCDADR